MGRTDRRKYGLTDGQPKTIMHQATSVVGAEAQKQVWEMTRRENNIINNEQNLFSPVCPVLDSQEYSMED